MTVDDPRRHKEFPDMPVIMTLESWSGEISYSSYMPGVPQYANEQMRVLWENTACIPSGYESYVRLHGDDCESRVDAKIILPSFNEIEARTLADRLEKFIEGEISIIKNGY